MGLSKRWQMPYSEAHSVLFRWEVFNVPNLKRFDVATITNNIDAGRHLVPTAACSPARA